MSVVVKPITNALDQIPQNEIEVNNALNLSPNSNILNEPIPSSTNNVFQPQKKFRTMHISSFFQANLSNLSSEERRNKLFEAEENRIRAIEDLETKKLREAEDLEVRKLFQKMEEAERFKNEEEKKKLEEEIKKYTSFFLFVFYLLFFNSI